MENQDLTTQTATSRCQHAGRCGPRFGRGVFFLLVALAAGFVGGYAGKSFAHGQGSLMADAMDPAQMDERVQRMVKHFAVEVDATPGQQEKLTTIAQSAAHDLAALVAKAKGAHQRAFDLMGAPTVDRDAIEALRAEHIAFMDTASKCLTQAIADAAEECARYDGCNVTGESVIVHGDRGLLRRLLRNLVENALRHGKPPVDVTVGREAGRAAMRVSDCGAGIAQTEKETVFEPFRRVQGAASTGTGLGLSLVRKIARHHGGDARIEKTGPGGLTVLVVL